MAIELMGRMHSSIIIYILLSGATFLLLSPLRLPLSPLVDPIALGENAINNLVVLSVLSLLAGVPLLLLKDLVYGNEGLNEKFGRKLWKPKKNLGENEKKESLTFHELNIDSAELAPFVKWANETELMRQLDLLNVKAHMLSAFVVACEICIPLNIIGIGVALFVLPNQFFAIFQTLLINLVCSSLIASSSWIYEKYYFRKYKRVRLNFIGKSFQEFRSKASSEQV